MKRGSTGGSRLYFPDRFTGPGEYQDVRSASQPHGSEELFQRGAMETQKVEVAT